MPQLAILGWLLSFIINSFDKEDLKPFHISGYAQGTSYSITYYAPDKFITGDHIEEVFAVLDSSLSVYKPYSLISRFNRPSVSAVKMDEHLKNVVRESLDISRETSGAFDITVQPLVQAWGFGNESMDDIPDSTAVQSLLACVGYRKLKISGGHLIKRDPCVKIDVNGIAQGYSVDVLARYLDSKGIANYLVELGGEIRIKGSKQPEGKPMSIGIEGPGNEDGNFPVRRIIQPLYGAVTSSGHYRRYYMSGSNRISHLIDAKTGYPLKNEMISVTVWSRKAITADAYDNALMSMGVEKALAFAEKKRHLEAYFIYKTPEGTVADTATTGFYKMMIQQVRSRQKQSAKASGNR